MSLTASPVVETAGLTLLKDPRLLILDEPSNGLDPAGMAEMRRTLRRLAEDDRTVLLSSHLLGEVQQICDRPGRLIARGRLIVQQPVRELRARVVLRLPGHPRRPGQRVSDRACGRSGVQAAEGTFDVAVQPARAAAINAELVGAGVAMRELRRHQTDLEELFPNSPREIPMLRDLRAEITKQSRRPANWLVVAVGILLTVSFGYLVPYAAYTGREIDWSTSSLTALLPDNFHAVAVSGTPLFVGALALIFGVLVWAVNASGRPGRPRSPNAPGGSRRTARNCSCWSSVRSRSS